jgi:hypothetical protein
MHHGRILWLDIWVATECAQSMSMIRLFLRSLLLQLLHQLRYYFEKVSNKADIRHLEDWCIRILVE